jgi:outer membrane protein assembly factor BamB
MKITTFLFLVSLLWACQKEQDVVVDADGVATALPRLWKTSISDDGQLAEVIVKAPIIYDGKSGLIGGRKQNRRTLISLKGLDGTKIWEWNDLLSSQGVSDPFYIYSNGYHLSNYTLFFQSGTNNYCVDIQKGETIWKAQVGLSRFPFCYGIYNLFFYAGIKYNGPYEDGGLYYGNTAIAGSNQLLIKPAYKQPAKQTQYRAGYMSGFAPLLSSTGDTLIAITYLDPVEGPGQFPNSVAALYNFSQRKWVYDRKDVNQSGNNGAINYPLLYRNRVYYAGGGIYCYDALTGEPIWSSYTSQGYSSFLIADGKVFANCLDRYTYCLDAETGQQLWKEQSTGGACSAITYLNGVIYFLGGGDGKLHAIDAQTGKHLWRLKSPDEAINSGAFFYGTCVAVPGKDGISKGRVIATTGLNAYGYEAAK